MFSDLEYSQFVPSLLVNLVHSVPWSVSVCEPVWSASFKAVPHSAVVTQGVLSLHSENLLQDPVWAPWRTKGRV